MEKGWRGAGLARAGAPGLPSMGLALSKPLAPGLQFLLSIGSKMQEVPEYSSWAEPWRAPNLSHYSADERTEGQRRCAPGSLWIWIQVGGMRTQGALSQYRCSSHTHTRGMLWEGRQRPPDGPQRLSQALTPPGALEGSAADPARHSPGRQPGPSPRHILLSQLWLAPLLGEPLPRHSGSFQETMTSSLRPRFSLTRCASGCDSQSWISAQGLTS